MSETETAVMGSPVAWGYCGAEPCDRLAVYEVRFSDWPEGIRAGCCAEHAADARSQDNLVQMWSIR